MANVDVKVITKLREQTGMGLLDIKKALDEAKGDEKKALELLKEKGAQIMEKKSSRSASQGVIETYVHGGRIGVILELNCETDFVARGEDFKGFAHDLVLQISSMSPENVKALLAQPFIKDAKLSIADLLRDVTGKMGEKIVIKRFVRYELGEGSENPDQCCGGACEHKK